MNELVMGGMVLETNMTEILLRIEEQSKIEKEEVTCTIFTNYTQNFKCKKVHHVKKAIIFFTQVVTIFV
jgi:hypothetical protein